MENSQDARFDKLEALMEKGYAEIKAELKEVQRQLEVKDTDCGAIGAREGSKHYYVASSRVW